MRATRPPRVRGLAATILLACALLGQPEAPTARAEGSAQPPGAPAATTTDSQPANASPANASPETTRPLAAIKVHGTTVLTLEYGLGGRSAAERANAASRALQTAIDADADPEVRVERKGERAQIWAGNTLLLELGPADALETSLDTEAARVASKLGSVINDERQRSEIADTVFSISLVVFFALIAFYALRKTGEIADRAYAYLVENPHRMSGVSLQSFEVIGPRALRSGLLALIAVGRFAVQISILYVWLVLALSRFEITRPLTERLTSFAVTPITELAVRFAAALPIALVGLVFGVVVYVLVRFTRVFFASVAAGETRLEGVPRDLAAPTGTLVAFGIIVASLVIAGPLVTGDTQGALARIGSIALLAIGLSATPLLASGLIGARLVFGRRLVKGEHVEIEGRLLRVREVTLLETRLLDDQGCELRVPHLRALVTPLQVVGRKPRVRVELWIDAGRSPTEVIVLLTAATSGVHDAGAGTPRVELLDMHAGGALYRVTVSPPGEKTESDVRVALVSALSAQDFALAQPTGTRAP